MTPAPGKLEIIARLGLFMLLAAPGTLLFAALMAPVAGVLVSSALSGFAAAAIANAVSVRLYEHGRLADFGLGWRTGSGRELLLGAACGAGAALAILAIPVLLRVANFQAAPERVEHPWASFAFVSVVLLFGAAGEEMLFHGYAFQLLVRSMGPFATILPVGVLFGLMHIGNQDANWLGILNTMAWGVLLGYMYWHSGALWLPIGLHFGWNFAMPLLGANLSGFTMGVTGYTLRWSVGTLWSGGGYGPEGGLLTTGVVVALFWVAPRISRK